MKGYPHWLNTRADYEYVADNFPRDLWVKDWQALLDDEKQWFFVEYLDDPAEGVTDETHRVETEDDGEGNVRYAQYEYKIDELCRMFQLGFTEEEVQAKIAEPEPEEEPVVPDETDTPAEGVEDVPAETTEGEEPAEPTEPAEVPETPEVTEEGVEE